jgi:CheY-like chemotaxis protein
VPQAAVEEAPIGAATEPVSGEVHAAVPEMESVHEPATPPGMEPAPEPAPALAAVPEMESAPEPAPALAAVPEMESAPEALVVSAPALVRVPAPEPPPAPSPVMAGAPAPRALIAEDSITASIFLERLLQQRGFAVLTVGNARDLRLTLTRERWDLVLVDVDLPDAPGGSGLVGLSPRRAGGAGAAIVALVRDREDSALARAAGVSHVLRKPFEHGDVAHVLTTLGFSGPRVRS